MRAADCAGQPATSEPVRAEPFLATGGVPYLVRGLSCAAGQCTALASAAVLALALAGSAHAQLSTSTIQGQVAQGLVPASPEDLFLRLAGHFPDTLDSVLHRLTDELETDNAVHDVLQPDPRSSKSGPRAAWYDQG